ncbi:uncharacterized protein [Typha angustifolia]|uniref:uncharacterized protein n=1 Tax=Typha angustifolia TaxID=59011 RepID=UPI003C2C1CF0
MRLERGNIKSTSINGVKHYRILGQRSTSKNLDPKKQRALRKDKDYQERVELIQDLWFETATTKTKVTPDGKYVIASGIYPPQIKVYDCMEMSLKFERHLVSEIINFQVLADDYSKIAFLCADRSVCLHAKYGSHYSLRIPRMGRDIAYDCWSCDLLCAASSPDLYRINLEQGRFLSPLTSQSPAINVVSRSMIHGLVACGGEDGAVECFDMRKRSSAGRISAAVSPHDIDNEVTALQFDEAQGYFLAVGSSNGKVVIYDIRMSNPLHVKDHMYGSPILNIKWHRTLNSAEPKLITSDSHIVRIWDPNTGENMTSIEPNAGKINDVCIFQNSGLMMLALDSSQIPVYFLPALGPAPKWVPYLENLTEEMEETTQTTISDTHKFVTRDELERLNLAYLLDVKDTNDAEGKLIFPCMHGYLVHYDLYKEAKSLVDPFAYDAYIEKRKKEKIEAERASRITIKRKLPKVNRILAARLLEMQEAVDGEGENVDDTNKAKKKNKGLRSDIFKDDRFTAIFANKDFEVDEESTEYLALHPQSAKRQPSLIDEHFEPVLEDEEQEGLSDSDASVDSQTIDNISDSENYEARNSKSMRLYEVKDERHAEAFWNRISLAKEDALPLGERVATLQGQESGSGAPNNVKLGPGGSREISFLSRSSRKRKAEEPRDVKKRGVQALGLKPGKSEFFAMGGRGGKGKGAMGGRGGKGRGGHSRGRGKFRR